MIKLRMLDLRSTRVTKEADENLRQALRAAKAASNGDP